MEVEMVVMENGESSDETKLNERRAIMQTRVISWWKVGKWKCGIKWGKCLFLQLFLHFFSSRYVLLPAFLCLYFRGGKQCQKLAKKLRQAVSTNAYFMLAAKGGRTERKLRAKKENTFCHFSRSRNCNK